MVRLAEFIILLNINFDLSKNDRYFIYNKRRLDYRVSDIVTIPSKYGDILEVKRLKTSEICDYIGMEYDDPHRRIVGNYLRSIDINAVTCKINKSVAKRFRLVLR